MNYDVIHWEYTSWVLRKRENVLYYVENDEGWLPLRDIHEQFREEKKQEIRALHFDKSLLDVMECLATKGELGELWLFCRHL